MNINHRKRTGVFPYVDQRKLLFDLTTMNGFVTTFCKINLILRKSHSRRASALLG